jgi:alkylation response protein AidB-like acyl-CoA dehydrogenase
MSVTDDGQTVTEPIRPGSPELTALLARIAAGAPERDREGIAPHEAIGWLKQAGLGRLRIPVAEGGAGASVRELFEVLIALAAADSHVAHILRAHFSFVEERVQSPDPVERARWFAVANEGNLFGNAIAERGSLAAGGGFATMLARDADGVLRLNGTKFYSTGSLYSDWIQVITSTEDGNVAAVAIPADREGMTIEDDWDGFGQGLTGTGTTRLENVRVDDDEVVVVGAPGVRPPTYQHAFLQLFLQAVTAGVVRAVRDDAAVLVRGRVRSFSHASTAVPAQDPQILQVVGEIAADAAAVEAIVLRAADAIQAAVDSVQDGLPDADLATAAQIACAEAKVVVDRIAPAAASRLFDAGGASATQSRANLDRHWRNARTITTHNPAFLKASAVGDWYVSQTPPPANGFF